MSEKNLQFLRTLRAALIMALNAVDDLLGLPRTVPCRAERRRSDMAPLDMPHKQA
jgi:hypothetical protein